MEVLKRLWLHARKLGGKSKQVFDSSKETKKGAAITIMYRTICFFAFLTLTIGSSFGASDQHNSQPSISQRRVSSRAAAASRRIKSPNPAPSHIGFISAPQLPASGGTYSNFPAGQGDFNGDGNPDVAQVVNTGTGKTPVCQISVALGNGDGTFQAAKLTPLTALAATCISPFTGYPMFVGDMNGDGKADIVILQQAPSASVTVWLSNGDGTFTETLQGSIPVTANPAVWATVTAVKPDTAMDIVVADGANPGSLWILKGNGDGTFITTPTQIPFTGQLDQTNQINPGFPATVIFGDFNGDGYLDFAAQAAPGSSTGSKHQMIVYLNSGLGGGYGTYLTSTALNTPDHVYGSCFNVGGNLNGFLDIVSANCYDNTVTVYLNNSTGTFSTGTYFITGADSIGLNIADVNGDGFADIISTDQQGSDVTVLLNDGTGNFPTAGPSIGYVTGGIPQVPALVVDKNADIAVPDAIYSFTQLKASGNGGFISALNYYSPFTVAGPGYQTSYGIASGDFNGDGSPDIVIGNGPCFAPGGLCGPTAGNITVFLSNGDGTLKPGVNYGNGSTNPFAFQFVAVGDFNGDGKLDIAATDATNGGVQIFTGNGDGTFNVGSTYATDSVTASTLGIVAVDLNNDGKLDLAVVNLTGAGTAGDVGVLINNGTGGFNPVINYPLSTPAADITAADLGNKQIDLLIPLYGNPPLSNGSGIAVLLGKGDGTFTAEPDYVLSSNNSTLHNPYSLAVGDLNGDGKPDLAITIDDQVTVGNQGLAIALGNGDGTFQANPAQYSGTLQLPNSDLPHPAYIKMFDLNFDGNLDLLYTNTRFSTVGLMYGKGDGTFYDPVEFVSGGQAFGIAIADLNGDGAPEVITSGNADTFSGATVLINPSGNSVALQSSANPAAFGASVTFTATVAATVSGVTAIPTGTVTFYTGTSALGSPVAVNTSGVAVLNTTKLPAGSQSVTAVYGGDVNFKTTTSAALAEVVSPQPTYTLAANPNTNTVNPGSSAQYTITLTPTGGYNGTVSFNCPASPLPAGVSCSFNPPTLSPTTANAITTTLTLTTTAPTTALVTPLAKPYEGTPNLWASLSGIGLLGLVLTGDWKKRRSTATILMALALLMILPLMGCGGGSGSSSGTSGGTPPGTTAVKVSATGTAGTNDGTTTPQTLTVTLVVN